MKSSKLTLAGREYELCLNTRVIMGLEDMGLSIDDVFHDEKHRVTNVITLLSLMMEAGSRWAAMDGREAPGSLTAHELADIVELDDYTRIMEAITAAMTATRKVEADPPKNAETVSGGAEDRAG